MSAEQVAQPAEPAWGADGLVAAVVQDARSGRVLMLGWMDAEAYDATRRTGEVHFRSRSRGRLWRKGESSGNVLHVERLSLDCDRDAVLVEAIPAGPTCHLGSDSCFDAAPVTAVAATPQGFAWLEQLWATIADRAAHRPAGSYTTSLLDGGVDAVARKVVEEATEVVLAAKDDAAAESRVAAARGAAVRAVGARGSDRSGTRAALAGEAGDLLFHALVLLAERGLEPGEVLSVLQARHQGQRREVAANGAAVSGTAVEVDATAR